VVLVLCAVSVLIFHFSPTSHFLLTLTLLFVFVDLPDLTLYFADGFHDLVQLMFLALNHLLAD
jgi:hypothetical protein